MIPPRFYAAEEDLRRFRSTLKLQTCPHCGKTGTLNLHGHLYGYSEHGGNTPVIRGHRLFCNNRCRRPGCGKTVGLWLSHHLRNFIFTLSALWIFLTAILAGRTKADAFRQIKTALHFTAAYRVFRRVEQAQSRLRAELARRVRPPGTTRSDAPLAATLEHLRAAFPNALCPPAEYQLVFQTSFPF